MVTEVSQRVSTGVVVVYLEADRLVSADVRTLRVYKVRGGSYTEGRQAFTITDDGISFLGGYNTPTAMTRRREKAAQH